MSRLLQSNVLTIGVATAIGAAIVYNSHKFIKKILDDQPPKRWRKVGEITDIWCFPVKACGPVYLNEICCGKLGPQDGHLRDRVFMVVRPNGDYVSAKAYPKMVQIIPRIEGDIMTLSAPEMEDLKVDINELYKREPSVKVKVLKDDTDCVYCGDEAARWFSKFLLAKSDGLRLVFYPSNEPKHEIKDRKYLFKQAEREDSGALHYHTSFMLMNQGSFDDLNSKLEEAVTPLQYRPNFVVKGPQPWEEDSWKWIKIGDQTVYKNLLPRIVCSFVVIDPITAERKLQSLKTLRTFRTFKSIAPEPWFGIHLGIRALGKVKVGDQVFVGE